MIDILMYTACQRFNLLEAFIWFGIGGFCLIQLPKAAAEMKLNYIILVIGFVAFGFSDLAEIRTGSWWHPWWMLLWKAVCLAVIGLCLWKIYPSGIRKSDRS